MIIAIDGPAAAGKGTLARRLAEYFDLAYLDTGILYRAVALTLIKHGLDPNDSAAAKRVSAELDLSSLIDQDLRSESVGNAASIVAAMPDVRSNLLLFQRKFAINIPQDKDGVILDGRDIGTVVCPNADIKFYVTASPEVRAERRLAETDGQLLTQSKASVLAEIKQRDERDINRENAPLRPAENALLLDTSKLDIDAVFLRAVELVRQNYQPQ